MAMPELVVTIEGTDALVLRLGNVSNALASTILRDSTLAGAELVVQRAQALVPVKTGMLRDSLRATVVESNRLGCAVDVGSSVSYARMVEEGTRAHLIEPKVKQALWWPTALHPVKSVQHPGTKPHPFLVPALEQEAGAVETTIRTTIERLLDGA
jgi:HK97 gp10 family phage protein